jgi:cyclopropane-fatty-acyl-phospholipid synthase
MEFTGQSNASYGPTPLATPKPQSILDRLAIAFSHSLSTTGIEAYINGLEIPDRLLNPLLRLSAKINYSHAPELLVPYEWLSQESDRLAENSQHLMDIQYNLPSRLFQLMLGESTLMYPKYTMALWEKGATTLEQAQQQMLDDIIEKLGIEPTDRILDLGCGWGSASHYLLTRFPQIQVTAVNLSHQQCDYIRQQIQNPDSALNSDRFTLLEADFNDIQFEAKFDKIIAIGLFEHIGNLTKSCQKLATYLNSNGKVFIHIISTTLPENITHPFINQYIFPDMRAWNCDVLSQTNQHLKTIDQWYINGNNYARTLKAWLQNFDNQQAKLDELNYTMNYPRFRRIWRLYLLFCIQYFESSDGEILGNAQYLLSRA